MNACPWSSYSPTTMHFCERRLCAWIVEPSNAWSNIAYLVIGVWILWLDRTPRRSALSAIGVASILVGLGSFAFHATATFVGEVLDISAMYLISGLFVVFNVRRLWHWSDRQLLALYAALVASSSALLVMSRVSGVPVFIAHVTVAGVMELMLYRRGDGTTRYLFLHLLIGFFAVSFAMWTLDTTGVLCAPDNHIFTGHAFWHVSNSFCLLWCYRFHQQFAPRPV